MSFRPFHLAAVFAGALWCAAPAHAQEDIEPRTIGEAGRVTVGLAGFIDQFSSSEETFPMHVTVHADVMRFLSARLAAGGGLIGSTMVGGDEDERPTGAGASSVHGLARIVYYFSPQSIASFYTGVEYRAQLTSRADKDSGTALAVGGVQAAVSSRVSVFVQGGYGARLTRGEDGELQTRITGELGFRLRL